MPDPCPRCGGAGVIRLDSGDALTWWYHFCPDCRSDLQTPDGEWKKGLQRFWKGGQTDLYELHAEKALQRGDRIFYNPVTGRRMTSAWWTRMTDLRDLLRRS